MQTLDMANRHLAEETRVQKLDKRAAGKVVQKKIARERLAPSWQRLKQFGISRFIYV